MESKTLFLLFLLSSMTFLTGFFNYYELMLQSTTIHNRQTPQYPGMFTKVMFNEITLMGQFNFRYPNSSIRTSIWCGEWSRVFLEDNIIIAIPEESKIKPNRINCEVMEYPNVKRPLPGFVSPYTNLATVTRKVSYRSKGILYVHDDLMVTRNLLQRILNNGKQWIVANWWHRKIKIYLNGNVSKPPKEPFWSNCCRPILRKLISNPKLATYLQKSKSSGLPFLQVGWGQSDMLYLSLHSAEITNAFLVLLDLFGKQELFLECAIPTAVSLIQQRFKIQLHEAPQCTKWDATRGTRGMLTKCLIQKKQTYEFFHPIKLSAFTDWSEYFRYLVLGHYNGQR